MHQAANQVRVIGRPPGMGPWGGGRGPTGTVPAERLGETPGDVDGSRRGGSLALPTQWSRSATRRGEELPPPERDAPFGQRAGIHANPPAA